MSPNREPLPTPSLQELQDWAVAEEWSNIDKVITAVAEDPDFITWATVGLDNNNVDLRDLTASLFEASTAELSEDTKGALFTRMGTDENKYVRFRADCALCAHGDRRPEVLEVIRPFKYDDDVAEIAKRYLETPQQTS